MVSYSPITTKHSVGIGIGIGFVLLLMGNPSSPSRQYTWSIYYCYYSFGCRQPTSCRWRAGRIWWNTSIERQMLVGRCCWFDDGHGPIDSHGPWTWTMHGRMRGSSIAPLTHTQHFLEVTDRRIDFYVIRLTASFPSTRFSPVHSTLRQILTFSHKIRLSVTNNQCSTIFGGSFQSKIRMTIDHRIDRHRQSAWHMAYSRLA